MSMTDPIADMLTRIRNATMRRQDSVLVPASRLKGEIARLLKDEGFISQFKVVSKGPRTALKLDLKYVDEEESVIEGLKRVSKPGRRVYVRHDRIPRVKDGYGVAILSTSRGVLTNKQSQQARVGGEVLCYIW